MCIDGYTCYSNNRQNININARRGSGGVAILVKNDISSCFKVTVLDDSVDGILWLKFENNEETFCVCTCYLPPENSRYCNGQEFYTKLLEQVYLYQNTANLYITGDFNSRCGDCQDFIEGVDYVPLRAIIDEYSNNLGDQLIEFLVDCNLCMLNGRKGSHDFTNISCKGKSVVDYVIIPHEQLNNIIDFKVHTMSSLISDLNLYGFMSVPDHSLLEFTIYSNSSLNNTDSNNYCGSVGGIKAPRRFKVQSENLWSDRDVIDQINATLVRIERQIQERDDVNAAYNEFRNLVIGEMESKCTEVKHGPRGKATKCAVKPYWNDTLQTLWNTVVKSEKRWKSAKGEAEKRRSKQFFIQNRKEFDRENRKAKRNYQISLQDRLHTLSEQSNSRDFWRSIGKLGLANDRKQNLNYAVKDENGSIVTDTAEVLSKWKSDYQNLFNSVDTDNYPDIDPILTDPDIDHVPFHPDVSYLNSDITSDEVRKAVFRSKLNKAVGVDEIPSELLRNDHCIDLLHKIIHYCFTKSEVPQEWVKSVITPVPKPNMDPYNPLSYRPISLISIPCKIYADVLNMRLSTWLEENELLAEEQNGFRKKRSCMDHIYSLISVIKNRKLKRQQTYVCFIDAKKAFDSVHRDLLWFKLAKIGV